MKRKIWFTGFDSAWGGRARGAICDMSLVKQGDDPEVEIEGEISHVTWDQAVNRIDTYRRENHTTHVISIDQPLVVPNATGHRPVDINLARALMGQFKCGAHAANRSKAMFGEEGGIWRFLNALSAADYCHSPAAVADGRDGRFYFECYPNLALIGLLGHLPRYKVRHHDRDAWNEVIAALHGGAARGFTHPRIRNIQDHVPPNFEQIKAHEDQIDAIIAAYVAARLWISRWEGCRFLGSLQEGYMVTPSSPCLSSALDSVFGDHVPPAAVPAAPAGSYTEWEVACMVCTDTGNLWGNVNPWLTRFDRRLEVMLLDDEEEREIRFVPLEDPELRGLKIYESDVDRAFWCELTHGRNGADGDGATKDNRYCYPVCYRFS